MRRPAKPTTAAVNAVRRKDCLSMPGTYRRRGPRGKARRAANLAGWPDAWGRASGGGRVAAVGDALAGQLAAVLAGRRELLERRRALQRELDEVSRRLGDRMAQQVPDRRAVAVELEVSDGGGELELEVSYLVDNARWE